ncbi:MAG TPA: ABC transporter permease subunit [Candidatus Binatia bacterium]|nr:ABC transporter permease subunit [Candidatus Binatia bacterium]
MATLTIARLTVLEATRRRLVLALVLLTLVVIGLTGWGFQHISHLTDAAGQPVPADERRFGVSQVLILVEFMFSGVLALSAAVAAAPAVSAEVESGLSLAILARPIGRAQVLIGKWLGLALLILLYTVAASALELVVVAAVSGYSPPSPVPAVAYLVAEAVVIMSLTLLLSTRLSGMTAGVIALVLFFVAWIGGIAGTIGEVFGNAGIRNAGTISQLVLPTDALWRGSVFNLEPALYQAVVGGTTARGGDPFFVASPPSTAFLVWCAAWLVGIMALAALSFRRREI